jgi:hypothetical protein
MVQSGHSTWYHTKWIDRHPVNCTAGVIVTNTFRGLVVGTREQCFAELGVSMKLVHKNWYHTASCNILKLQNTHSDITVDNGACVDIAVLLNVLHIITS